MYDISVLEHIGGLTTSVWCVYLSIKKKYYDLEEGTFTISVAQICLKRAMISPFH